MYLYVHSVHKSCLSISHIFAFYRYQVTEINEEENKNSRQKSKIPTEWFVDCAMSEKQIIFICVRCSMICLKLLKVGFGNDTCWA